MYSPKDELIRIDAHGVAHPIGVVASQRMRRHEGTYRSLPSPDHVIFLRYTGEDGVVDEGDGAIVRLAGEIAAPGSICDILALLGQTGWRGVLSVHSNATLRKIYLDGGNVIGVRTTDPDERIGRVLYRFGHLSDADLEKVEAHVQPARRFGEVALDLGFITREALFASIRAQVTEVTVSAMRVSDGTFFFLDDFDPAELGSPQAVSVQSLLMDGVTRMDELGYFGEKIPSIDHVPVALDNQRAVSSEHTALLAVVDGKTSVRELGRKTGLGEFETMKRLFALVQSKHVQIQPPGYGGGPEALLSAASDALAAIFTKAKEGAKLDELCHSLDAFTIGAGPLFDLLLQGAGPDRSGRLDTDRVIANLPLVAGAGHPDQVLGSLLYDYVTFALFSVGSALGQEHERDLRGRCELALAALSPHLEPPTAPLDLKRALSFR